MKFKFNLKNKEVSLEADVEGIVKKNIDNSAKNPERKTSYQIKQEEKRKNEELKHQLAMEAEKQKRKQTIEPVQ